MKKTRIDAVEVWKQLEDELAPRLKLNAIERAVYAHLLRHTRLEGKLRQRFTMAGLALRLRISRTPVRKAVRRLAQAGAVRLVDRSYGGHLIEVRLPAEVLGALGKTGAKGTCSAFPSRREASDACLGRPKRSIDIELVNFLNTPAQRQAIHGREGGRCFYCQRPIPAPSRCLDHVVPQAKFGKNSYRNLVSCCAECNWKKGERAAADFLRELYCEGTLSRKNLNRGLKALQDLAAGKLRPQLP